MIKCHTVTVSAKYAKSGDVNHPKRDLVVVTCVLNTSNLSCWNCSLYPETDDVGHTALRLDSHRWQLIILNGKI